MSKKQQEKTGGEAGKQPDQSGEQGQQEQLTQSDQDKQPDTSGLGQSAGEVSIRTVNVPNNRRYRGGLCFTEQARVVNLDDLDEDQVKAILDDPYLKKD